MQVSQEVHQYANVQKKTGHCTVLEATEELKAGPVLRDYLGLQQQHKKVLKHLAHEMNWHHDNLGIMTN